MLILKHLLCYKRCGSGSNVPGPTREVDIVKEMRALVAEPLVVDEVSLIKPGPVRFQGRCRNPAAIEGDLEFFFNGMG